MATSSRKYGKAPIVEAVIDIRIAPRPGLAFSDLRPLHETEKTRYPVLREDIQIVQEFSSDDSRETTKKTKIGYMLRSADDKRVVQALTGGFTFSWLAPYDTWGTFRKEALRLWAQYVALTSPTAITRIAVRYVNRLDLPQPVEDLRRYVNVGPDAPPSLLAETEAFLLQLRSPQRDAGANLILNVARVDPPSPDVVSIILDLDLYDDTPPKELTDVGDRIEVLHARVESIFEQLITEDTRALIT